jgi:hypothetical protein
MSEAKKIFLFGMTYFLLSSQVFAAAEEFKSSSTQTPLIELFSSEGCSSCPPADAWLASLRKNPGLWHQFIPIEFHVDYWNQLGWVDRLSKAAFTARQQSYADEWSSANVYTPAFVLNGAEWSPSRELPQKHRDAGILSVRRTSGLAFSVTFDSNRSLKDAQIHGALLANGLESHVRSGENAGSTLRHEFVVVSLVQNKMDAKNNHYTALIERPPSGQKAELNARNYSVAFWVSAEGSPKPLQAVGGDIDSR